MEKVHPGMERQEFVARFGEPYKKTFAYNEGNSLDEDLYYKEQLYIGGHYTVTTVFRLRNGKLVSQSQEKEEKTYSSSCDCGK